jgi:hypothetical protein
VRQEVIDFLKVNEAWKIPIAWVRPYLKLNVECLMMPWTRLTGLTLIHWTVALNIEHRSTCRRDREWWMMIGGAHSKFEIPCLIKTFVLLEGWLKHPAAPLCQVRESQMNRIPALRCENACVAFLPSNLSRWRPNTHGIRSAIPGHPSPPRGTH